MTALMDLNISFNLLKGMIPESVSKMGSLKRIQLQDNRFSGTLDVFAYLKNMVFCSYILHFLRLHVG